MTQNGALTLQYDDDVGQVTLSGLPAGAAGSVSLLPADGLELLFDCADGRLAQVVVEAGPPGGPAVVSERIQGLCGGLLGPHAGAVLRDPARWGEPITIEGARGELAALSRLARLDAARPTSADARSPWWAAEAAHLAARAGLDARARAETERAATALAGSANVPLSAMLAFADLTDAAVRGGGGHPAPPHRGDAAEEPGPPGPRHGTEPAAASPVPARSRAGWDDGRGRSLQWWLDPRVVPAGLFRFGPWPADDLTVRREARRLVVGAELAPGADRHLLAKCHARLVDPAGRSVIGAAPFREAGGATVRAEISQPVPRSEAWVEVVGDVGRPVLSGRLHRIRRAVRWADAALRAERVSPGRAAEGRRELAAEAWRQCARDWAGAADADRAYLALARHAARCPGVTPPAAPSAWAGVVASGPGLREPPFLAETDAVRDGSWAAALDESIGP